MRIDDIVAAVAEHMRWEPEQAARAEREYRSFLSRAGDGGDGPAITPEIDAIWHEHILHTRRYRADCEAIAGRFVDHEPGIGGAVGRLACCGNPTPAN